MANLPKHTNLQLSPNNFLLGSQYLPKKLFILPQNMEAETRRRGEDLSSAEAVLIGALAPGVNGPTWNTLKISFLMLGVSLVAMLGLAFSSSDAALTLHVAVLVLITGALFFLLSSFLAQTGLVSVEHQMKEIGLAPKDIGDDKKEKSN